jgi:hypothetical protein
MVQQSQQQQEQSKGPTQQQSAAEAAGLPGYLQKATAAAHPPVLQATTTPMTATRNNIRAH